MKRSGKKLSSSSSWLSNSMITLLRQILMAILAVAFLAQLSKSPDIALVGNVAVDTAEIKGASYELAFRESLGFFDDVTDEVWKDYQIYAREQIDGRYAHIRGGQGRQWGQPHLWYYNNFSPIFNCPQKKRVWGLGDGPKWVCDPHRLRRQVAARRRAGEPDPLCLVYSVGSNGNYEFEDGLHKYTGTDCEVHIFDYSADYDRPAENEDKNFHFHRWGLQGSQQHRGPMFFSFQEILKKLGHEYRTIDIFKIDCEGCEWDTYKDWITHDKIRQVLVETHRLPTQEIGLEYFQAFKKNNFAMYSKEVNGFGNGQFYEFSYIKLHPNFLNSS